MKKLFCLLMAMVMLMLPVAGLAEAVEGAAGVPGRMDWTPIALGFIGLLGTVVSTMAAYVFKRWIKPLLGKIGLDEDRLSVLAQIFVDAAEATYGRYNGDLKLQQVLDNLREYGFNVDSTLVIAAVKAAWKDLDMRQRAYGDKDEPPDAVAAAVASGKIEPSDACLL